MRLLPILNPPPGGAAAPEGSRTAARAAEEVPREKRVHFEVFGCQMNKLDAEIVLGALFERGYRLAQGIRDAGVILFETCAVREHAEDRVFSRIGALRALKEKRPDVVIAVLGCSAQNRGAEIFRRYPHVGVVCGPGELLRLPELLEEARRGRRAEALDLDADLASPRRRNLGPSPFQAYVSAVRGCDEACSFCVVPKTRGREVSRPVADIIEECRALAAGGVREITLLGQTVNSYGKRLAKGRRIGLHHVLEALQEIAGLERIRFVTSHPKYMSAELIEAMASLPKVCEYLHLPIQSGSDSVLRRMVRRYTAAEYRRIAEECRARIPRLVLATDFIVGFPGETEDEFAETLRLLDEVRFQGAFVFKYSERRGTRAARLHPDDVPDATKRARHRILLERVKDLALEHHRSRIGETVEVLVEGKSQLDPGRWTGRTRGFEIVVFPAVPGEDLAGAFVPVRVADATPLVLVGERPAS
ncbi:MAG: tRNA (N6-isopentenyl adenosine(37)-C2)-methylthiotransferase MiaB [Planctomycetota bacterium]